MAELLTTGEVAKAWRLETATIRAAVHAKRLKPVDRRASDRGGPATMLFRVEDVQAWREKWGRQARKRPWSPEETPTGVEYWTISEAARATSATMGALRSAHWAGRLRSVGRVLNKRGKPVWCFAVADVRVWAQEREERASSEPGSHGPRLMPSSSGVSCGECRWYRDQWCGFGYFQAYFATRPQKAGRYIPPSFAFDCEDFERREVAS